MSSFESQRFSIGTKNKLKKFNPSDYLDIKTSGIWLEHGTLPERENVHAMPP